MTTPRSAWRWLGTFADDACRGVDDGYYDRVRGELLDMIEIPPRVVLDIGCGGGATDAELMRRYGGIKVIGVEPVPAAAKRAETKISRVICANAETLDFAGAGIPNGSIDLILVADVLEHMYDPWHMLQKLRPLLAANGRILASIPNVRNLWLLEKIVRGGFDYSDEGLLDITHIRFFTYREMRTLLSDTGYAIERTRFNIDGNLPERVPLRRVASASSLAQIVHAVRTYLNSDHSHVLVSRERAKTYRVDTARLALKGLTPVDLDELFSSQIYLMARLNGEDSTEF